MLCRVGIRFSARSTIRTRSRLDQPESAIRGSMRFSSMRRCHSDFGDDFRVSHARHGVAATLHHYVAAGIGSGGRACMVTASGTDVIASAAHAVHANAGSADRLALTSSQAVPSDYHAMPAAPAKTDREAPPGGSGSPARCLDTLVAGVRDVRVALLDRQSPVASSWRQQATRCPGATLSSSGHRSRQRSATNGQRA